ncbi:hypothetical protein [Methylobacterium oxalidis]|uniref:Uncharacterized protein n=1 Tax=Methylobacterium oxalidis TaxID=944322 RepID=A0A512J8Y1_9HYPH|nr:hypothetical protein [Methylobacterium oxalidis]GEP06319.1 hypothetical protein MOX02_43570 [Methylobacterium oxalidis]GLS64368.1 hypothetical protein GCM10007888_27490 [Methylobacterium oxalidis]
MSESPLDAATRHVAEAERCWDRQIDLIATLAGQSEARTAAEQVLLEIQQTLRLARAQRALIRALDV